MSSIHSLDYEAMQLPVTGRMLWGHPPSSHKRLIIQMSYKYVGKYLLGCMSQDWDLPLRRNGEIYSGPTRYYNVLHACKHVINEFDHKVTLYYVNEKEYLLVTRLKLGIVIPTIESRASKISRGKGNEIRD